jgi:hypothetical protein
MSTDYEKATPVPEQLRKFLCLGADVKLPRTEVAKQIYSYVREKDLRDKDDRRIIHPDVAIQKLFNLKKDETINFKSFKKYISLHYPDGILDECWSEESEDQIKVSTEQELLAKIEELKKKAEELRNKAKEMEEQNEDTEFNKQRNFLIDTVRNFLGIEVSDAEVLAVLYRYYGAHINTPHNHIPISYYLKQEDENMLSERKVFNRYAKCNEIRYEDSVEIINNFLIKIKSKDQKDQLPVIRAPRRASIRRNPYESNINKPLFC